MADYSMKFLNDLLKQIGIGINISRTYPKGHPSLKPVVQRLRILLKEMPIEQDSLSLVIIEDVIMIENERFESKQLPIIKSLVQRFNQIGVKSITFSVDQSEENLAEFFVAMTATPADIADYGDIEALVKAKGLTTIKINKFRVGVMSSDEEGKAMNWEDFVESLTVSQPAVSDEARMKELTNFLTGLGIAGGETASVQTGKIVSGLEKIALLAADQYGEDRWDEYSLVFSRMLSVLSPTIKKNVVKYRTENKKLAVLFKTLIPTMADEDIIDVISMKTKEKSPRVEQEVIDILKNVTGSRLPGILSSLRVNVPELDFEKIVARLMSEMKTSKGEKAAGKFMSKNLETEMRVVFPHLRDQSREERIKAIDKLMEYSDRIFEAENNDLLRLLIDRFDAMADAETESETFLRVIDALKSLYLKSRNLKKDDIIQFISKKFGKHLLRRDVALIDRKKAAIKTISEIKDENYVPELVSLLWDPGTFTEARSALISLAEFSVPLLIETLKETEDRGVRMKIIDVLVKCGEPAVPEIKKLLSSSEWYIRRNGVFLLGEIKMVSSVDEIGRLIDDDNEQVQTTVIESLNKIGSDKGKDYIKKGLDSKYKKVILGAMKNLEKGDVKPKIVDVAHWLKSRKGIPDVQEEVFRREAINILAEYGDDSAVDTLVGLLNEKAFFKGDLLQPTKRAALNALAKIGSEKAFHSLRDAVNHKDEFVAATAEEFLKKIESRSS